MQSGIEIAVCCQHQLLKHILDKVRYDFFAAAGGGFKQRCRAADRDFGRLLRWWKCRRFRRPNFRQGRLRTRPTRRQRLTGAYLAADFQCWNTAAERWIGIGKFINKTSKKMQTFLNKFWKVREQAGKFSMKAHVPLISHIKNEGISDLLVACFLEG